MSRQREWQKRKRAEGKCRICGADAVASTRKGAGGKSQYCSTHLAQTRERQRTTLGSVRRNTNAASYHREKQ